MVVFVELIPYGNSYLKKEENPLVYKKFSQCVSLAEESGSRTHPRLSNSLTQI